VKPLRWLALLAGLALFAVSFNMVAVKDASSKGNTAGILGYKCATLSLSAPWGGSDSVKMRHDSPIQWFSLLISGWINPAFILGLLVMFVAPNQRWAVVLRCLVALMFVFCWIFFYKVHLAPLQGYYLWMTGILLALLSNPRAKSYKNPGSH
jgi:hypothetical protein